MIELISLYKIGVLSIFSKFLVLDSEEEILQKLSPWRKGQVIDFCAMVLFSNIYGISIEIITTSLVKKKFSIGMFSKIDITPPFEYEKQPIFEGIRSLSC